MAKYFLVLICSLFLFNCCSFEKEQPEKSISYSKDIAAIIYKNCTPCHRPGSGAPFDLITYKDIKSHLKSIQLAINERLMPPWPADTNYVHFKDEKVLTKNELALINNWILHGAIEGNKKEYPLTPEFPNGSLFGKPDLTISMKKYQIQGNNLDNFIMVKIPFVLEKDTFLKAIEIVPGNKKLVHHVNAHLIQYNSGDKLNYNNGVDFVNTELHDKLSAYKELDLANDNGSYPLLTPSVSNYLPGVETAIYPEGIGGYRIKKNIAILLDNIHYGPSPIDTFDQTTFNLFFSTKAPTRPTQELILGTSGAAPVVPPLIIPPGTIKKFSTAFIIQKDISLLTVNPHMHLLGSTFKAYAITPLNDTIKLISIRKWDFRWQYFYTYKHMLKIPSGSTIIAEATFDNTVNNPLNPFNPPRTVSERNGSMRTTDEMFQLICTFVPYQSGDENISLENKK